MCETKEPNGASIVPTYGIGYIDPKPMGKAERSEKPIIACIT
jgi:hypothetical protein